MEAMNKGLQNLPCQQQMASGFNERMNLAYIVFYPYLFVTVMYSLLKAMALSKFLNLSDISFTHQEKKKKKKEGEIKFVVV